MRKLQYFFENQPDHINAMNENYLSGYTKMKKKINCLCYQQAIYMDTTKRLLCMKPGLTILYIYVPGKYLPVFTETWKMPG